MAQLREECNTKLVYLMTGLLFVIRYARKKCYLIKHVHISSHFLGLLPAGCLELDELLAAIAFSCEI